MRMNFEKVAPKLKRQIESEFAQIIADFKNPKEVQTFLEGFFNESEIQAFAKRLAIADWLTRGKGYILTKLNIKVSSATVASVKKKMPTEGYQLALRKLKEIRETKKAKIERKKQIDIIDNEE